MDDSLALPEDVASAIAYIGSYSETYGYLKWNEEAKLKSSMMLEWPAWEQCSRAAIEAAFQEEGFGPEDLATIMDLFDRRAAGRRLVPSKGYRDYKFGLEIPLPDGVGATPKHSREW